MPILLQVKDIQPGMQLASNVINRYSILLPHGRIISEGDIHALIRKFPDMYVQVLDPVLDKVVEFDDDKRDKEVSLRVRRSISQVTTKVSEKVRGGLDLDAQSVAGIEKVVQEMLEYLMQSPVNVAIVEQSSNWNDYLQEHSANVFYLSILMGNTVRNYIKQERERLTAATVVHKAMDLTPLATGALFHDIGMARLEYLYQKTEPLTPQEIAAVRAHPRMGAELLPDTIDPMARIVVRQHHENQAGNGYPDNLSGDKINIFARIVRVVDAYSAAIANKVYQKAKTPVAALHEMLHGDYSRCYDPMLLKVFASIMQPLPIGAKIQLQDGRWAVVVRHNRKDPFRPEIIVAFDHLGDPLNQGELRPPFMLGEKSDVRVQSFAGEDISFINHSRTDATITPSDEVLMQCSYNEIFDLAYP